MRVTVTHAVRLLPMFAILGLLAGCDQKAPKTQTQALAPPIVDTPPPKPATVSTADLPPPVVGTPKPAEPPATTAEAQPEQAPRKPVHRPKKPATQAAAPAQEAASGSPSVSAIGELSSGASGNMRSETEDAIHATEKGLNGITRPLSDSESKTAAQIREFLKQARQALATGDVDGAATLTKKAKVLLAELSE